MQININLTMVFDGKRSQHDQDSALFALESAVERLQSKFGSAVAVRTESASNAFTDANRAYLTKHGLGRTPKVSGVELRLREKLSGIEWDSLEARHTALLTIGYNVFNPQRDLGKRDDTQGETFDGDVDITAPPAD